MVLLYGLGFGWLAAERHVTLRTNAEDLGFTDQLIWNFLRGQAFRFSLYERAEFETDVDLAALRRPDSLLAFHVEPILVLFAPLYLLSDDVRLLLWLQAILVALGAIPAYRFARRRLGSGGAGLAFAAAYLLAPVGQWALLSDFHSVALAAPLLMLAIDALDAGRWPVFLVAGLLATATKEEIGLVFAGLGLLALGVGGWAKRPPGPRVWAGLAAIVLGAGWSLLCVGVIIPHYSGGAVSPFTARYAHLGGSPAAALLTLVQQPAAYLEALARPEVQGYAIVLLLAGGWLALLAPEWLLPAGVVLALNVFSSSPWMSSGRAHYSASVLPLLIAAATVGTARAAGAYTWWRKRRCSPPEQRSPSQPADSTRAVARRLTAVLSVALVLGAAVGYHRAGGGPLADGFVVPERLPRHALAARLVAAIPPGAPVSATTTLVPHVSRRPSVYLFPTLRDADYVLVDVAGNAFPISPGGLHRRVEELLSGGEFRVLAAEDGLLLLEREAAATRPLPDRFFDFARATELAAAGAGLLGDSHLAPLTSGEAGGGARAGTASWAGPGDPATSLERDRLVPDGGLELVSAALVPSGDVGPRGPLATLATTWTARGKVVGRPRPSLHVFLKDGSHQHFVDLAMVWWYPPERWRPGELVRLDVPGLPLREVERWQVEVAVGPEAPAVDVAPAGGPENADVLAGVAPADESDVVELRLGELMARVERDPWRLALLDPSGRPFWQEAADGPFGYRDAAGDRWRLTRLLEAEATPDGARLVAATDEPNGRTMGVELRSLGPRTVRLLLEPSDRAWIAAIGGAAVAEPGEHFLGFGERFDGVDQRGRIVRTWAQDRRDVGFGEATYAPIPSYISSRGYGFLVESDARGAFDVARSRADRVAWELEQPAAGLVLGYGPEPRELVRRLTDLTGRPPLPPIWAFGVWKTTIGGEEAVRRDAARLRAERLPVSGLLIYDAADEQAFLGWPHVGFAGKRPGRYTDLRALNERLHGQGFKTLGYKNADLSVGRPGQADAASRGLLVRDPSGAAYVHPHHRVSWVDFTNPDAVAWWGGLWRRILGELGFDGAMLDLGEIVPEDARYADGTTGIETHNRWLGLYARASFEAARAVRGEDFAIFARSGSLGAQRYQSLQWSGDQTITWDRDGIGGLVPAALSIGLSGFPYWHPEAGGYLGVGLPGPSERELWFRWLQLGALSPLLRDNYGEHDGEPVEVWSDRETVDQFRRYARLHNSLVPYLYSQARIATETGLPIVRHLVLGYPDDPRAWTVEDSYTLGDDLLVAPVLEEGARLRTVYLPRGRWVDWWTGQLWEGGRVVTVEAPLDQIPIFARAGAILPLAPDFDTLAPTADPTVSAWNGDLIVRIVAPTVVADAGGEAAAFRPPAAVQRLYDGTELRTSPEEGDGRAGPRSYSVSALAAPGERTYHLLLPAPGRPTEVLLDGLPSDAWSWADGTVSLTVRAASFRVTVRP